MSAELTKARSLLSSTNSSLKQGKLIPAVQAVHDAVAIIFKSSLMKTERDDFTRLIDQACYQLGGDANLKKVYPLVITYRQGQEKELLGQLVDLLRELQQNTSDEAQQLIALRQKMRADGLLHIAAALEAKDSPLAQRHADKILREFPNDADLLSEIADLFVKAEAYAEALVYLEQALKYDPQAIHLYNRIGMVLRRMHDFATAEQYFFRALEFGANDEYLWFNIGRLYHDMQRWDKMAHAAEKAAKINPTFAEARKMLAFAQKKMAGG